MKASSDLILDVYLIFGTNLQIWRMQVIVTEFLSSSFAIFIIGLWFPQKAVCMPYILEIHMYFLFIVGEIHFLICENSCIEFSLD